MSLFQTVTGPISTYPQRGFPWQRNETEKKIDTQKVSPLGPPYPQRWWYLCPMYSGCIPQQKRGGGGCNAPPWTPVGN